MNDESIMSFFFPVRASAIKYLVVTEFLPPFRTDSFQTPSTNLIHTYIERTVY